MAKAKTEGATGLARSKPTPTLAIRPVAAELPAIPKRSRAELLAFVDETSDYVGARERAAGAIREEAADYLFRHVYLNSTRLVLDPEAPEPPAAAELEARGGKSFPLTGYELRRYARVGAMNHHLRSELWKGLPFDAKLELVRLLPDADHFADFEAGVLYAATANVGAKALRDFVGERLPESEGAGRPRGLTPKGVRRLTATVDQLDDAEHQERLADRIARLEDERARDALVADLEKAAKNIARVVAKVRRKVGK